MFGLDEKTLQSVCRVLKEFPSVEEARIYGSRALGHFRANSDVDIVLFGLLDPDVTLHVAAALDVLPTPYQFDVAYYDQIQNSDLKDHIDRVAQTFYRI